MYLPRASSAAVGAAADTGSTDRTSAEPAIAWANAHRLNPFTRRLRPRTSVHAAPSGAASPLQNGSPGLLVPALRLRGLRTQSGLHHERILARVEVVSLPSPNHAESEALVQRERLQVRRPHF